MRKCWQFNDDGESVEKRGQRRRKSKLTLPLMPTRMTNSVTAAGWEFENMHHSHCLIAPKRLKNVGS